MAQESIVETDNGIIITNNVELSTNTHNTSGNPVVVEKSTQDDDIPTNLHAMRRHNISISSIDTETTSSASTSSESDDDEEKCNQKTPKITTDVENVTNDDDENFIPIVDNSPAHNISTIAIKNSTNVRIGNTQEFHAPVTIQQFMIDEERKKWTEVNGVVNNGFVKSLNNSANDILPTAGNSLL